MTDMKCIGILAHPLRPKSFPLAKQMETSLKQRGINTWLYTAWEEQDISEDVKRADMVIAIGGDGAMLRAGRVCAPLAVPVLSINIGRLGFLTEIANPDDWEANIDRLLKGEYWLEERSMIYAVVLNKSTEKIKDYALNDIVLSGQSFGKMVQLDMFIDGDWATAYNADALIVSTATGSTAYALACGGPILPPQLNNMLIIPSAAHLSMDRPIVLAEGMEVVISPTVNNRHPVIVSADGREMGRLEPEDQVKISISKYTSSFVRLRGPNYFYRSLLDRLEPRIQHTKKEDKSSQD
jgi:NAD+ kinase